MKAQLLVLLLAVSTTLGFKYTQEWEQWKSDHAKKYESDAVEKHRYSIWEKNMMFVEQHNAEEAGFEVEMNEFADLVSLICTACSYKKIMKVYLRNIPARYI